MGTVGVLGSAFASLGNGQQSMVAWTSADGSAWVAAPASDALKTGQASDMATFSTSLVAVGRDSSGAVSWTSPDGKAWTRSTPDDATNGAAMNKVSASGAMLFAVGHDGSSKGALWGSTDGLSWTPQADLPGSASDLTAIATKDAWVVVFGSTTAGAAVLLVAHL
jgi:hypothetical protein